ncbi:MAG: penicillin-binding protein 2 [Candidatus Eisenbacteria bacterium]|nr:penicillin-binding protein 2 [Candidatus Eisenbacteria bacterium]
MRHQSFLPSSKHSRARVLQTIAIVLLAVIVGRLFYFQVWHGKAYAEQARNNRVRLEMLPRIRGRVLDRNGKVVVENTMSYCLLFDPFEKEFVSKKIQVDEVLRSISNLLATDGVDEWNALVQKGKETPFRPVTLLHNLDIAQISILEEHREELPGTRIEARPRRSYEYGELACHLVGYMSEVTKEEIRTCVEDVYQPGDMVGRVGVEGREEEDLRGRNGKEYVEVDARGRRVEPTPDRPPLPPQELPSAGMDLVLTLDVELQKVAEEALGEGRTGAIVVIDPRDGAILAMVSKPGFDPNVFSVGLSSQDWEKLNSDPEHPLLNRVTQALYPPGSTMKLLTAAAALEEGVAVRDTQLEPCTGSYRFGRRSFGCWRQGGHGKLTFFEAIEASCDVYFYQLGLRLGIDKLARYANRFGLNQRTGIKLAGEKSGFYPNTQWYDQRYGKRKWGKGVLLNLSIGQGEILVTPIGLASLCAAVANGGYLYEPYVVAARRPYGSGNVSSTRPLRKKPRSLAGLSKNTTAILKEAMEAVVSGPTGTGRMAAVQGVRVAGKTGTAQNPHGGDHALFVGFAPVDNPEIAFAIVVENAGHGGSVAAPIAREIVRFYFYGPDTLKAASPSVEDTLATE